MRILAIECASPACSVALFDNGRLVTGAYEEIGRGHAERLVPLIASLPEKGQAERVCVSLGPGSFTGVRIGLAAARALGIAWRAEVLGYPTLALVAAMARATAPAGADEPVSVAMLGGHGEWFVQEFDRNGLPESPLASLPPAAALAAARHRLVAGSAASELVALRGGATGPALGASGVARLPDARCLPLLPPALLTASLAPLYGRAPDARPTAPASSASEPSGPC